MTQPKHTPVYVQSHNINAERLTFSLPAESLQLLDSLGSHNRKALTLAKQPDLSIVLMAFKSGDRLAEHGAPGTVTIQVLSGHVQVSVLDEVIEAQEGMLVQIANGVKHDLLAEKDSVCLITVAAPDHPAAS